MTVDAEQRVRIALADLSAGLAAAHDQKTGRAQSFESLIALLHLLKALEAPAQYQLTIRNLAQALSDLEEGRVPPLLRPKGHSKSDDDNIWTIRAEIAGLIDLLHRCGYQKKESAAYLARTIKHIEAAVSSPYPDAKKIAATILSWEKRLCRGGDLSVGAFGGTYRKAWENNDLLVDLLKHRGVDLTAMPPIQSIKLTPVWAWIAKQIGPIEQQLAARR